MEAISVSRHITDDRCRPPPKWGTVPCPERGREVRYPGRIGPMSCRPQAGRRHDVVVRSLDADDQHRLVDALLRIDAMRTRKDRTLYISALERDLGHRLPLVRHDRDRLDLWALVDA